MRHHYDDREKDMARAYATFHSAIKGEQHQCRIGKQNALPCDTGRSMPATFGNTICLDNSEWAANSVHIREQCKSAEENRQGKYFLVVLPSEALETPEHVTAAR